MCYIIAAKNYNIHTFPGANLQNDSKGYIFFARWPCDTVAVMQFPTSSFRRVLQLLLLLPLPGLSQGEL